MEESRDRRSVELNKLIKQWEPFILKQARNLSRTRPDLFEDLCQVGRMAVFTATRSYKPGVGRALPAWIFTQVSLSMRDGVPNTNNRSRKKKVRVEEVLVDSPDLGVDHDTPESLMLGKQRLAGLLRVAEACPGGYGFIVEELLRGKTEIEIGAQAGRTNQWANYAKKKALTFLAKYAGNISEGILTHRLDAS